MTKKFYAIVSIVLFVLTSLGYIIVDKIGKQSNQNFMPNFVFSDLAQKSFSIKDIPLAKNYVILYFSPDCHYCTDEVADIIRNEKYFRETFILLISPSSTKELKIYSAYLSKTKLNVKILHDNKFVFTKYFGASSIPSTIVYNRKLELIKKISGGSSAKLIYSSF